MITSGSTLISFYDKNLLAILERAKKGEISRLPSLILDKLKGLYWEISGKPDDPIFGERLLTDSSVAMRAFLIDRLIQYYFLPWGVGVISEFRLLESEKKDRAELCTFAEGQRALNRHTTPYDTTLVSRDPYLNANFVFDKTMIAAQAPFGEQTADFWDMVAAHEIETVVSLWGTDSEGYFQYYPGAGEERWFFEGIGSIVCEAEEEWREWDYEHLDAISIRELSFDDKFGKTHKIQHIQVHTWKDMTAPTKKLVLKILSLMRGKPLIHCAAGIGRSGTIAVLAHIKAERSKGRNVSVLETVRSLRDPVKGRCPDMVETAEQYFFIHSLSRYL